MPLACMGSPGAEVSLYDSKQQQGQVHISSLQGNVIETCRIEKQ